MGYQIVITSGGTSEKIDNVRKITNSSSGKLGYTIANTLLENMEDSIEKIYYLSTKNAFRPAHEKIDYVEIEDTNDLKNAVEEVLKSHNIDYFIHSMAVSDYTVDFVTTAKQIAENIESHPEEDIYQSICSSNNSIVANKISSYEDDLIIKLKRTPKIISMIKDLSPNTYLVGFKLLDQVSSEELIAVAKRLRDKNRCDLVVANDLNSIRNGLHEAFLVRKDNSYVTARGKEDIAFQIMKEMFSENNE